MEDRMERVIRAPAGRCDQKDAAGIVANPLQPQLPNSDDRLELKNV